MKHYSVTGTLQKIRQALARSLVTRPDEKVLSRIALQFTPQLEAVDSDEQCVDLYRHVQSLPSTTT